MQRGKLTISIDLELAWGVWDYVTPEHLRMAEECERPIVATLIDLFDRYDVPATWAIVAALLDEASSRARPGCQACWYAPDLVERLLGARTAHEVGSHSGRHIYFDTASAAEARADLEFASGIHRARGLPFRSFVFPRGAGGHLDLLAGAGLRVCNYADVGWVEVARGAGQRIGQAANLVDKLMPIPPHPAQVEQRGALVHIAKSMLLMGRNGPRRFILPAVTRAKLRSGLERARRTGGIFHFWFHPSNFYYRREEQFATLAWFLEHAAKEAELGHIELRTMGSYAMNDSTEGIAAE
jgi:peptidoglycan/xylan/chitin deacetylase (PgdA/CDA1 family)